jgi:hypothetical protein
MTEERPEEKGIDEAPEGASEDARPDEGDVRGPAPEQPDPESDPGADERQEDS